MYPVYWKTMECILILIVPAQIALINDKEIREHLLTDLQNNPNSAKVIPDEYDEWDKRYQVNIHLHC